MTKPKNRALPGSLVTNWRGEIGFVFQAEEDGYVRVLWPGGFQTRYGPNLDVVPDAEAERLKRDDTAVRNLLVEAELKR